MTRKIIITGVLLIMGVLAAALAACTSANSPSRAAPTFTPTATLIPVPTLTPVPVLEIILVPTIPLEEVTEADMLAAVEALERGFNDQETTDATVRLNDTGRIVLRLPGVVGSDSDAVVRYVEAVLQPRSLEFVDSSMVPWGSIYEGACILTTEQVVLAELRLPDGAVPPALSDYSCPSEDPGGEPEPALLNYGQPFWTIMTGAGIGNATATTSGQATPQWVVSFRLKNGGDRVQDFLDYVGANANLTMAIVLDGRLLSNPVIQQSLADSARAGTMRGAVLPGNFTEDTARVLAAQLRIRMLPIPLQVESVGMGAP